MTAPPDIGHAHGAVVRKPSGKEPAGGGRTGAAGSMGILPLRLPQ